MPKGKQSTRGNPNRKIVAKTKTNGPKKQSSKSTPQRSATAAGPRRLKIPDQHWYMPWRRRYIPIPERKTLPKARHLFASCLKILIKNWKLFGGIILIYGLLNFLFVRGLSGSSDLISLKDSLDSVLQGASGKVASALLSFTYLLGTSGSSNSQDSGVYQSILLIIGSLAFIWALRQAFADRLTRIRDSFYRGMYPLIPFLLVLFIIGLQLIPLLIGSKLYSTAVVGGITIHGYESLIFGVIFALLAWWSLYMIISSVFALYIVCLPDMTPLRALHSARQLVFRRRLLVLRKIIFLPIIMLIGAVVVELPLILFATPVAPWIFFILSMIALGLVHIYMYGLYRAMIDE
ncbi:MAG: hypothetical protein ABI220_05400 [Candidatus Saccharimonadales bacterium]